MEGFEYVTELKDGMSRPARDEAEALRGLQREVGKTARATHELERVRKGMLQELIGSMVPEIALGELLGESIKKLGEWAVEAVSFSLEVAEFKENMVDAYSVMLGTTEKGEDMFASIDRLARGIHAPAEKAHKLASDLLIKGMENEKLINATIGAITAMQRVGLEAGAGKIQAIIDRSLAAGKFIAGKGGERGLARALAGTGVQVDDLLTSLASQLGVSRENVKAQLKASTIDAERGIAGLLNVVNAGKIGGLAAKKFTLTDALTDLRNNLRTLFQDVDIRPLMNAFGDFVGILSGDAASGKTLKAGFTDALNTVIRWVGKAIEAITIFSLRAIIVGLEFEIAFAPAVKVLLKVIGLVEKFLDMTATILGPAGDKMFAGGFGAQAVDTGKELSLGIADGTKKSAGEIARAALENAHLYLQETQAGFGIQSPSKEMAKLGRQVSAGFALGVAEGAAHGAALPTVQLPSGTTTGGGTTVDVGGIRVEIHGVTNPHEVAPLIESQLMDIFERIQLELGG